MSQFKAYYGTNARIPGEGPYTVRVHIDPPSFMRHHPVNGKRYADPVTVVFEDLLDHARRNGVDEDVLAVRTVPPEDHGNFALVRGTPTARDAL